MAQLSKVLFLLVFVVGLFSLAAEPTSEAKAKAKEITYTVMSPFCPGKLLADCSSNQAAELREKIRQDLAAGKTKQQVLDDLFAVYGDSLQSAPETSGFGLTAWIAPALFLLLGGLVFFVWAQRFRNVEGETQKLSPDEEKKLQKYLDGTK